MPQDVILDAARFTDEVVTGGVEVVQLVPSYLEVILNHLQKRPGGLGRVRFVSVTGEALRWELAARWFRRFPDIKLVNAYGLTETSDDTNHEVLDRAPEDRRVPLGRLVQNVTARVVDENLELVPLGAPGEIVFSGVCVARGYINDPERTGAVFLRDPHRPGQRLYRSGDIGRWIAGGKLEFLGRRDAQVKIRGHRVELGEIEEQMLRVAGVRGSAVVVTGEAGGDRALAGFYATGADDVPEQEVRAALGRWLPEYAVPSVLHRRESLPTSDNGKIDKKALAAWLADRPRTAAARPRPRTSAEQRLAAAWAEVLNMSLDEVSRDDHFFDSGGTSITAIRMIVKLDGAFSLSDVTRRPVLADLADLVERT
ncbi:non-ribosomal peptide synthetase [Micromonospora tarensis]|uniref:Non-ribosomal peptide synthetase n=1 Tax=Micromonospora tarensis TaxID=2806100 RepID=A0ABS1YAL8_9ACTN|nr:non-ribosomal peptide synthetase [Micromonospora tarensis]MBM0274410.1 non-ribosomal peptide synthetase [Micromonospora tarensis]